MNNKILEQESVIYASRNFLTSSQDGKNKIIDKMFLEQLALIEFVRYIDKLAKKEPLKEIVLQLMAIFFSSFSYQKIQLKKISIESLLDSVLQNSEMEAYFHNPNNKFDGKAFGIFFEGYAQKEILNYTYFAINNQFKNGIETEEDALFIFHIMKIVGDLFDKNIK